MVETERDYDELMIVCCRDFEEIQDDGLKIHDYTDEFEAIW